LLINCKIGVDYLKIKELRQRVRPETEQLKLAAIVYVDIKMSTFKPIKSIWLATQPS